MISLVENCIENLLETYSMISEIDTANLTKTTKTKKGRKNF